jgi:phenylacetic acid degradation protein
MGHVYSIDGVVPVVEPTAFVHPQAVLIGDVIVGAGCYIGPMASLRGDFGRIVVGAGSNVQDSCVLHAYPEADLILEPGAHVGHTAVLHGCTIRSGAFIGIASVVLDGAVVGEKALVGANSLITAGFEAPPRHLLLGSPARVIRELNDTELAWMESGPRTYSELAQRCLRTLQPATPLSEVEPNRKRVARDASAGPPLHERGRAKPA